MRDKKTMPADSLFIETHLTRNAGKKLDSAYFKNSTGIWSKRILPAMKKRP
jgi:hypothetical protein